MARLTLPLKVQLSQSAWSSERIAGAHCWQSSPSAQALNKSLEILRFAARSGAKQGRNVEDFL